SSTMAAATATSAEEKDWRPRLMRPNVSAQPRTRSFALKSPRFAIRQPQPQSLQMVEDRRRFALIILNERDCPWHETAVVKEIGFRFGIKLQNVPWRAFCNGFPDEMISLSPNRHLRSNAKHVIGHYLIFADTGIQKPCVQLDGCTRCRRLRSRSRQLQKLEGSAPQEDGHGDVALQPGPATRRKPGDDHSPHQRWHQGNGGSHEDQRGPTPARSEPAYRNHRRNETEREEAPARDAKPAGNDCYEQDHRHGDDLHSPVRYRFEPKAADREQEGDSDENTDKQSAVASQRRKQIRQSTGQRTRCHHRQRYAHQSPKPRCGRRRWRSMDLVARGLYGCIHQHRIKPLQKMIGPR